MDQGLNGLLKWGVQNSSGAPSDSATGATSTRNLNPEAISALFGGPSEADLLKASMSAILSDDPEISIDDKLVAFDNFEQLIENLDNANLLAPLALWTPLLSCLKHEEAEIRKMAAWCVGTAVQNNEKSQDRCLAQGGVELLTQLACKEGETRQVRRKAIYALSSECRNYQPAMDVFTEELTRLGRKQDKVDAADMDAIDAIINGLREEAAKSA